MVRWYHFRRSLYRRRRDNARYRSATCHDTHANGIAVGLRVTSRSSWNAAGNDAVTDGFADGVGNADVAFDNAAVVVRGGLHVAVCR